MMILKLLWVKKSTAAMTNMVGREMVRVRMILPILWLMVM